MKNTAGDAHPYLRFSELTTPKEVVASISQKTTPRRWFFVATPLISKMESDESMLT